MPDYVWALHDFVPENPDEVPFKVGDKIEVVERDDLYQDGWWQGRNPAGVVGLFPKSYTSDQAPPSSTLSFPATPPSITTANGQPSITLTSVAEETEVSPATDERERTLSQGEQVMKATISDVQKAIEQLGRSDRDGAQSFSFASSHGDYTDRSETETDGDSDDDGQGWHKDAREKLAARAKQENEERRAKEAAEQAAPSTPLRSIAPPIEVELSDESEGEDDEEHHTQKKPPSHRHSDPHFRPQSLIAEEDEVEVESKRDPLKTNSLPADATQEIVVPPKVPSDSGSAHIIPSEEFIVPLPAEQDELDVATASADRTSFPISIQAPSEPEPEPEPLASIPSTSTDATPTIPAAQVADITPHPVAATLPSSPVQWKMPQPEPVIAPKPIAPTLQSVPSTIRVTEQLPFSGPSALPSPTGSSFSSTAAPSSFAVPQSITPATTVTSFKTANFTSPSDQRSSTPSGSQTSSTTPMEWSVEEVVEWLKTKGFDEGICSKFIEQEITGDVLLELDQNVLKTEIGIVAFGKRARIVNAIAELRRPASVSSERQPSMPVLQTASRSQSINYSQHSHTPSIQSSTHQSFSGSPLGQNGSKFSPILTPQSVTYSSPLAPPLSAGLGSFLSIDSSPADVEYSTAGSELRNGWRSSDPGTGRSAQVDGTPRKDQAGLGLGFPSYPPSPPAFSQEQSTGRPAQLNLSQSDVTLKSTNLDTPPSSATAAEDRGVLSDSETAHTSDKVKRRRLFGRSAESSSSLKEKASSLKDSSSRTSKDFGTPISGPIPLGSEPAPTRRDSRKRSGDERKPSDRLSLFGSSFSSSIGKGRKPPPRLSTSLDRPETTKAEKSHTISTFSRIRHPDRKGPGRPSTSDGTPKLQDVEKGRRDLSPIQDRRESGGVLRKRTASTSSPSRPTAAAVQAAGGPALKPGRSILDQIGTPDHSGWMRKKGDRYNTWKLRYFVLKGPHLYCLRSDSNAETKIKGYINIGGYRVQADENLDPGRYGFQIVHDNDKSHYFSHDELLVIRGWMKALMKATITRDYTSPVVSSSNIPTIPLTVAQAMNPAPRPPSPTAREATQRAHRRENPNQLSSRDAQILMSLPPNHKVNGHNERARVDSFFTESSSSGQDSTPKKSPKVSAPPRPSRETRRISTSQSDFAPIDMSLLAWANSHLPESLQMPDPMGPVCGGVALLRIAESVKGMPCSPPVPDSAFPSGPYDDKLDGLFRLFDFLLDNDVKMGSVSINDIRQGKRDKVVQLLRALKSWEDKRRTIAESIGKGPVIAGPFMGTSPLMGMAGPMEFR